MQTVIEDNVLTLELKYCEWCGALWFRPPESDGAYCQACTRWIDSQLPAGSRGEA